MTTLNKFFWETLVPALIVAVVIALPFLLVVGVLTFPEGP